MIKKPWGKYYKLFDIGFLWVKIIVVNKGQRTSLQYHFNRTEIHIGGKKVRFYPPLRRHRMTCGRYLEIAWGKPREEDIVRLKDDYDRIKN